MAATNICICIFMALVATNFIFAEEEKFSGFSSFPFGNFPSSFGFREADSSNDTEGRAISDQNDENQDRLFFRYRFVSCNFTAQAGSTCANCRQALRCFSSNVGILRNCRGFLPYCNNNRCSFIPGTNCTSSG